jgi:hypothetical protein
MMNSSGLNSADKRERAKRGGFQNGAKRHHESTELRFEYLSPKNIVENSSDR